MELEEYRGKWIELKKGSMPEDILPDEYWHRSYTGYLVQSFPVKYKSGTVTGLGIRIKNSDGTGEWDNKSTLYGWWRLRDDAFKKEPSK